MDTDSTCWVCSLRFGPGDRVTRLASLGFEVHSRCADAVLRDEPLPEPFPEEPEDLPQ